MSYIILFYMWSPFGHLKGFEKKSFILFFFPQALNLKFITGIESSFWLIKSTLRKGISFHRKWFKKSVGNPLSHVHNRKRIIMSKESSNFQIPFRLYLLPNFHFHLNFISLLICVTEFTVHVKEIFPFIYVKT